MAHGADIVRLTATELAKRIRSGEVSSAEVVEAHIESIESSRSKLNALVLPLFEQARAEAQAADQARREGRSLGPLHGVPISVKELFDVAGVATTAGLTNRVGHRAPHDAPLVARLRGAGAIVLGKTNVPQIGMLFESDNPVYGRTNNPWNVERSAGGSSGGEAAIVAAFGSPLGLASDGGGSIRQPCHSCGVYGLKPTGRRLTMNGHWMAPNWSVEWAQAGPIARSVADLELALHIMNGNGEASDVGRAADLTAPPVPWRRSSDVSPDHLRVGYYTDDGCLRVGPAIRRAIAETVAALKQRGAQVEPFRPPDVEELWRLAFGIFYADGTYFIQRSLADSQVDWRIRQSLVVFARIPTLARLPLEWISAAAGQRWISGMFRWVRRRRQSTAGYFRLQEAQREFRQRFRQSIDAAGLDVIICPVSAVPALRHGSAYAHYTGSYTMLYNLLGMPAGTVPVTRVRAGEDGGDKRGRDLVEREAFGHEAGSAGLPIGVQVVGRHWREDVVLCVMGALEEHFRRQPDNPGAGPW
ncbi:MAG: amidase [Planctomycetaceae bacterium]